ncbi:MAG: DUF167 domain-containing protein [Candidatus Margulisbacteria bacterium]|nr:DUF167 domain-containing protein [Candidatus Margulisiibacteriota bacterium]
MHETNLSHTITASIITKAQKESITLFGDNYKIKINETPEKGKANEKIIKLLAKRLKISQKNIRIIKGVFSNKKTILISEFTGSLSELLD